ncbi:1-acyl-sn-glycerol-3-phosphate acyltransferase [Intrasporangium sp. YIM S08009]|uniref:1-acyl-sn-glycerol-3-phosphate acyltransferase n=1 Tax=Intrasporangium zincisolvens TaxID=3080018 RepID=UPI002B058CA9|nr:1-acyl-sn-glycerol-3-phosphate acyltransferase [Intrasporangium sp. YIM S08009]
MSPARQEPDTPTGPTDVTGATGAADGTDGTSAARPPAKKTAKQSAPKKSAAKKPPATRAAKKASSKGKKANASAGAATEPQDAAAPATAAPAKKAATAASRPPRGAFAAGAARASGERLRRSGTPLLSADTVELSAARRRRVEQGGQEQAAPVEPIEPVDPAEPVTSAAEDLLEPTDAPPSTAGDARTDDDASAPTPRSRPSRAAIRAGRTDRTESASRAAHPTAVPTDEPGPGGRPRKPVADTSDPPGTPDGTADRDTAASVEPPRTPPVRTRPPRRVPLPPASTPASPSVEEVRERARLRAVPPIEESETGDVTSEGSDLASALGLTGLQSKAERLVGAVLEAAEFSSESRPGPAELVELAVNVFRAAATSAGLPAEDVERQVAETLAYLRRRLTGDYTVDEFGFDEDYTVHVHLPLLRPFYRSWFRVEVRGIENIPAESGALVVGNHSGTVAMDSLMTQVAVYDEHPQHRHLRMLGADLVFQLPFIGTMARRSGSTLAANTDAERLLRGGELVGVWPEGFKGVGKPFSERYKLQRFGRGGFVSAALRAGVPIVPVSIVGAEEIYPILGNMPAVARLLGLPYAPITPTFPLLGPLGMIPLPSKWLIEFGPPIDTTSFGPDAADDPMLVFDLTDQVRETIQQTLYSLLMQRKSVFL